MPKKNTLTKKKPVIKKATRYGYRCLGKGIYVSNDTKKTGLNNNCLVIGGSGSGKSGSIVYPQLKTLSDSSLIVADTKNMLHRMFKDELEKKGFKVRVLDFVNPEGSCRYNPLDYVRMNPDGTYNELDIMKISSSLIPDKFDRSEPFWPISARAVLDFFIAFTLSALPEEDHDMYSVCRLYRLYNSENGELAFAEWLEDNPGSFAANRYAMIKNMKTADKTFSSILAFCNVALYPFDCSALRPIFSFGDFFFSSVEEDIDDLFLPYDVPTPIDTMTVEPEERDELSLTDLAREKTVVFLNVSDTDHSLDNLVNLFYSQALQTLISEADKQENGKLPVPCHIIFDDFASGTVLNSFDKIISVIRSRDLWVSIMIQSLSQLESLYSHANSLTIINNCDHIIYMGSNDMESAEFVAMRANKVVENVLSMDRTKEYFIEGGKKAVLVDKVPPYSYSEKDFQPEIA